MNGIENWFTLINIFGNDFNLIQSEVEYSSVEVFAGRMTLDIIINHSVKNPPQKWDKWDKIYTKIDFFGVKETHSNVANGQFIISKLLISHEQNLFEMNIQSENNDFINCKFVMARVQNIKPLIYNELEGKYEVI